MANVPFQEWIDGATKGIISTNLDRTFKLEEAAQAHEYMEANKVSSITPLPFRSVSQTVAI
jgi:Zinc-binding dehydrogenase